MIFSLNILANTNEDDFGHTLSARKARVDFWVISNLANLSKEEKSYINLTPTPVPNW